MVVRCALVVLLTGCTGCAARHAPPTAVAPSARATSSPAIAADAPAPSTSVVPDVPLPPPTVEEILSAQGAEYLDAAYERLLWRDGDGCLAELDALAKLDPKSRAAMDEPRATLFDLRTHCLMLAGKCESGKKREQTSLEGTPSQGDRARIGMIVDGSTFLYCKGGSLAA